jgi:hypothetical protein
MFRMLLWARPLRGIAGRARTGSAEDIQTVHGTRVVGDGCSSGRRVDRERLRSQVPGADPRRQFSEGCE